MLDAKNYLGRMLAERYLLVRVIGHGASSTVFYAQDMMTKQDDGTPLPVAIKVLDRDAGEYKLNSKSYRTEISAVADIPTSPHIIAVKDVSFFEDEHFIVMEYVSGKTLKDYIAEKGGTLSPKEIVSIPCSFFRHSASHMRQVSFIATSSLRILWWSAPTRWAGLWIFPAVPRCPSSSLPISALRFFPTRIFSR